MLIRLTSGVLKLSMILSMLIDSKIIRISRVQHFDTFFSFLSFTAISPLFLFGKTSAMSDAQLPVGSSVGHSRTANKKISKLTLLVTNTN